MSRGRFQHLTAAQRSELGRRGGQASPMKWTATQAQEMGRRGGRATPTKWTKQDPRGPIAANEARAEYTRLKRARGD